MESVWSAGIKEPDRKPHPSLKGNIKTDVLVIGGGMAGILTAYRLGQAGVNCVVAEARTVGDGITKNTTAKVTAQHGLIYKDIIRRRGLEMAKAYLKANGQAVADFRDLSKQYPCDFEEKTAHQKICKHQRNQDTEAGPEMPYQQYKKDDNKILHGSSS